MSVYVTDPIVYPVVFSLERRNLTLVDNRYATVTFCVSGQNKIAQGVYVYDGNYVTDVDLSSEEQVVFIKDRKKPVFEFLASSEDINSAIFSLKIWKDSSSFSVFNSGSYINARQSPWYQATTSAMFYSNNSMRQFSATVVENVSYYPSVSASVTFDVEYHTPFTITDFVINPGQSITKNTVDYGNRGVLSMMAELSATWYYDSDRTLVVTTPPSELTFDKKYFVCRVFMMVPGYFSYGASTSTDGLCIVDGVLTKDYILSISGNYGAFSYTGNNTYNDGRYFRREDSVIVDNNGYCAKPGSLNQIYFLEGDSSSSSSCSSSSSSMSAVLSSSSSSYSCSCSSSSCSSSSCSSSSCSSSSCSSSSLSSSSSSSTSLSSSSSSLEFSPLDIAGLQLWLDANNPSTLWQDDGKTTPATNTNDVIGAWADASTNSNDAKQTVSASKPKLKLSVINGLPVVKFDGADDLLTIAHNSGLNLNAMTIFVVGIPIGYPTSLTQNNLLIMKNGSTSGSASIYGLAHYSTAGTPRTGKYGICVNATGGWSDNNSSSLLTLQATYLLTCKYNGSSQLSQRMDGISDGTLSKTGTVATSTGTLQIGGYNASWSGSEYSNWEFGEILIYNSALSSDDTLLVEAYLREKWTHCAINVPDCILFLDSTSDVAATMPWDDTSGKGNVGILTGNVTVTTDNGAIFDGNAANYVNVPSSLNYVFSDGAGTDYPFSVSFWAYNEDYSALRFATQSYVSRDGNSGSREWNIASDWTTGNVVATRFDRADNDGSDRIGRQGPLGIGIREWFHVVATFDNSQLNSGIKIYVNGLQVDDSDSAGGTYHGSRNTASPIKLGRASLESDPTAAKGKIDSIAVFSRVITAGEISQLYTSNRHYVAP